MTFEYEGVKYKLVFQYGKRKQSCGEVTNGNPWWWNPNGETWAKLYVMPSPKGLQPVMVGLATCARGDVFSKEVGRKVAIARMLGEQIEDTVTEDGEVVEIDTRDPLAQQKGFRRAVWEAYLYRNDSAPLLPIVVRDL